MDLGITRKHALVCASSKGLGFGCAQALAREGVSLVMNGRSEGPLLEAAQMIRDETGVEVTAVVADITSEEGRAKVIDAAGEVDILVTNAGGPPAGMWTDWDRADFIAAMDANMLAPIALMQAYIPQMSERKWGRVVNITSVSVKAPIAALGLSNTARTGLTGFVAGTARQVAKQGVIINNLLPGVHDTDRMVSLDQGAADTQGISFKNARVQRCNTIPVERYGTREEFGAMCAFLCSQHVGYMVGQNVLLDGGATNTTF